MTELPGELKKAELTFMSNGFITRKENYDGIRAIPSGVVASFLENARKELEKLAVERRQVALAEYTDLKEFRTWKKELWVNLSDALAVFGGEEKTKEDD